jgi:DNA polymerase III sliding clamp (beta) subunit (PCNA family)
MNSPHPTTARLSVPSPALAAALDAVRFAATTDTELPMLGGILFLLHALTAGAWDELILELGAPTAPLAIRRPDDEGTFSLLMPVGLEN